MKSALTYITSYYLILILIFIYQYPLLGSIFFISKFILDLKHFLKFYN